MTRNSKTYDTRRPLMTPRRQLRVACRLCRRGETYQTAGTAQPAVIDLARTRWGMGWLFERVPTGGELYMITEAV